MRTLDTAYNYQRFDAHHALARTAGDLLDEFTVSTKVGYLPDPAAPGRPAHSLDPGRLRRAIEHTTDQLGRTPQTVLLHNPEVTLATVSASRGRALLSAACATLAAAAEAGWCRTWGIATWDARPLVGAINPEPAGDIRPDVLMLRAGVSVDAPILTAGERLSRLLGVGADSRWGMSPFGGTAGEVCAVDLSAFLAPGYRGSTAQVAFRVTFELPAVARVVVGTANPVHLTELVDALELRVRDAALARYRRFITEIDGAGPVDRPRPLVSG